MTEEEGLEAEGQPTGEEGPQAEAPQQGNITEATSTVAEDAVAHQEGSAADAVVGPEDPKKEKEKDKRVLGPAMLEVDGTKTFVVVLGYVKEGGNELAIIQGKTEPVDGKIEAASQNVIDDDYKGLQLREKDQFLHGVEVKVLTEDDDWVDGVIDGNASLDGEGRCVVTLVGRGDPVFADTVVLKEGKTEKNEDSEPDEKDPQLATVTELHPAEAAEQPSAEVAERTQEEQQAA